MAIADTISSMYENVGEVYDTITNVDLPTNKNIQNIPSTMRNSYLEIMNNGIDKIWNNWEKVTGSGTDISLSPTLEAPMRNVLNGNTYQFTTTGKNLLENTLQSQTANGITFTRNDNGSLTFSGTATQAHSITGRFTNDMIFRAGVTYIFSLGNKQAGYGVYLQKTGNVNVWYLGVSDTNSSLTITPTEDTTIKQLAIHFPNGNTVNGTIYPMVRLSSVTDSTYEPYTGGQASPNPQYPQDIHVVSGDNAIKVESRNLLNANFSSNTINGVTQIGVNNVITLNGANNKAHSFDFPNTITYEPNTTYTTHVKIIGGSFTPYKQDSNWAIQFYNLAGTSNITLTSNNYNSVFQYSFNKKTTTKPRIWFGWEGTSRQGTDGVFNNLQIQIMVVKGAYSLSNYPTFEPYDGNIYDINLPVENKFDDSTTTNILIADDGTEQANSSIKTSIYIKVEPNTIYTCSSKLLPNKTSGWLKFSYYDVNKNYLSYLYTDNTIRTITTPNNCEYIRIGYHTSIVNDVQFEVGSKANSYTPYGTTPIELCDFNTYKDNFLRTSGKNLFNDTYNDLGMWVTNIGVTTTFAQGSQYLGAYCKVEPGTYTISRNKKTNRFRIGVSPVQPTGTTSSCYVVASNDDASSITIDVPQGNNYICIYLSNNSETSTNVDLMIEKGSSASDYEPYGSGEWYLKQDTNKVLLNGTETISSYAPTSLSGSYQATFDISTRATSTDKIVLSDYFASALLSDRTTKTNICYTYTDGLLRIANNLATTMADFKTWLSSNNTKIYYVLATPIYTKITYEPLLEQLEAFYNAKSKNHQTNITQENNDLPFIIDSTMLKEV